MPLPASIEAQEYSRWDDDDLDLPAVESAHAASPDPASALRESDIIVAGDEADGGRLDKWLAAKLPMYSRSRIQRWIADGHVRIEERVAATRDAVWKGDRVTVEPQPSDDESAFLAEDVPLDIVDEDDTLLVLDKRAGLVVHPASGNWSGTVLNGLLHHAPTLAAVPRAGIVHRLDKDTSGLMVVAKTIVAQTDLVRQLQARTVGRTYVAIVHGKPPKSGRITWPIGRDPHDRMRMKGFRPMSEEAAPRPGTKPAATRFETLASIEVAHGKSVSLIVCRLETGRTHQIRVHLQAVGHPLVGDATYGGASGAVSFGRQALHAWHLRLIHPTSRQPMAWRADLPIDLATLARALGFDIDALLDPSLTDG
jgi:23S rRNA pseudouridine1911/1915/1917 synthase